MFYLKSFLKVSGAFLLIFMGVYFLFAFLNFINTGIILYCDFYNFEKICKYNSNQSLEIYMLISSFLEECISNYLGDFASLIFVFIALFIVLPIILISFIFFSVSYFINESKKIIFELKKLNINFLFLIFINIFYIFLIINNFKYGISLDNLNVKKEFLNNTIILSFFILTFLVVLLIKFILDKRSKHEQC